MRPPGHELPRWIHECRRIPPNCSLQARFPLHDAEQAMDVKRLLMAARPDGDDQGSSLPLLHEQRDLNAVLHAELGQEP